MMANRPTRMALAGLGLVTLLIPLVATGQIQDIQFDLAEVRRGSDTVTSTITVRNPTGSSLTYYVAGKTQRSGTSGYYLFSPTRQPITLDPGATGVVNLTWAPSIGVALGSYDFDCRLYRTASGTDVYSSTVRPAAFEVIEPTAAELLSVSLAPSQVARGLQTVTASVSVYNGGSVTLTCYVAGLTQRPGAAGWYFFSPTRHAVTLSPGETNSVNVTWAPSIGVETGDYDFLCRLHKTSSGNDLWDSVSVPSAFELVEPYNAAIAQMSCAPDRLESGVGTITATVSVVNSGFAPVTSYVAGLAQLQGSSGYYFFSPTRQAITLDAGQTGTVSVTWSPPAGVTLDWHDFTCRLYRTSNGTDLYDEEVLPSAFMFYDPFTARGSVTVGLAPSGAVAAGARWRIDAGAWHTSGEVADDLYVGFHYVDFMPVEGWAQPEGFDLILQADELYQATADYSTVLLTAAWQGGQMLLQWPDSLTGFQLESSSALGAAANWGPVVGVDISDGQHQFSPVGSAGFYRLGPN